MTDPTRGGRLRRGGRRPGWILMTVLLVLAIVASSALVFTSRVELLRLAVILALWAAVVAAFVSVIYRRQSDSDQAKVRDLKLVYDLQLEREISARREYELSVESHLRRELASELSAQSSDEVASLRAELAALRANLEYLFDADLSHRPALETERTAGRVSSSRIDTEDDYGVPEPHAPETDESPIIDVPAEPQPPENMWDVGVDEHGGAHRRSGDQTAGRRHRGDAADAPRWVPPAPAAPADRIPPAPSGPPPTQQPPAPPQQPAPPMPPPGAGPPSGPVPPMGPVAPEPHFPWLPPPPQQPPQPRPAEPSQWQPAPPDGQFIPAGEPGSNWVAAPAEDVHDEYVGRRRAPEQPAEPLRGRHSVTAESAEQQTVAEEEPEEPDADGGAHTGGQSVAELLARLQATPSGGGGRRRRED